MGIDPSVEGERFNAYDGNRIQASSQFLEPRGITVYSEVPYVVGSGQLNGRLIAKPSHLRKTISKLGRSFHFGVGRGWIALEGSGNLSQNTALSGEEMVGDGIRIRLGLPGRHQKQ